MLGDSELKALGERGKEKKDELEEKEVGELHKNMEYRKTDPLWVGFWFCLIFFFQCI